MKSLIAFVSLFALGQCKSVLLDIDPEVHEANLYADKLLAAIRTNSAMKEFDPLKLPFHRQDVLGTRVKTHHWILSNATATGLSTLHRYNDCLLNFEDGERVIRIVAVTDSIQVVANLHAELSTRQKTNPKVYGSIQQLSIIIRIALGPNGEPKLKTFLIDSIIYLDPEVPSENGKFEPDLEELVHDAMYYGFSTKYGFDIAKVVTTSFKNFIESVIGSSKYSIMG